MALTHRRRTVRQAPLGTARALLWGAGLGFASLACDAQVDADYTGEPLITIHGQVEAPLGVAAVEVGLLWLRPATEPVDDALECSVELSGEAPSACVVACGAPSCDDIARLEAWDACAQACDGPNGVSRISIEARAERLFAGAVGQTTPARGEFPSRFQLDLLQPPTDVLLSRSSTSERLALGLFVALDPAGAPFELELGASSRFPPWLVGGSGSHLLAYSPDGVPAGSEWSSLLELELTPGFHLIELISIEAAPGVDEEEGLAFEPVRSLEDAVVRLKVGDPASIEWPLEP